MVSPNMISSELCSLNNVVATAESQEAQKKRYEEENERRRGEIAIFIRCENGLMLTATRSVLRSSCSVVMKTFPLKLPM